MRLVQLKLTAFGPFTDVSLDLSGDAQGLQVIYGPNEAGKSSALRAIHNVLYGIPLHSADDFIHPYRSLRIGASLMMSDGATLDFVRRKANRQSLRGSDDQAPLADDQLDRFLAGIDESMFLTMFGIDHARLVKGGEDILQGGGAIGELLFAAGAGLADLHHVQQRLSSEADFLFKPSGRNPRINQAIHGLQAARKEMGRLQLSVDDWNRHDGDLRRAETRKVDLDTSIVGKRREQNRLTRIRNGLPVVARWKRENTELESCRDVPLLTEDFARRRTQALNDFNVAKQQEKDAQDELDRLSEQTRSLDVPEDILAEAATIEHLRECLGSHRKAMSDRPRLETSFRLAEKDAEEILKKIGRVDLADDIETLRLPADKVVRIQSLANQYEGLVQKVDATRRGRDRLHRVEEQLRERLRKMPQPADTNPLKDTVQRIQQEGDLESQARAIFGDIAKLEGDIEVELAKLPLWSGGVEEIERLPAPSRETIDQFEEDFRELKTRLDVLSGQLSDNTEAKRNLETRIGELEREHSVPTEADLTAARRCRDEGCVLLVAASEGRERNNTAIEDFVRQFPPASSLSGAYRLSVTAADEVADRLRREADRVATKSNLQADLEDRSNRLQEAISQTKQVNAEQGELTKKWQERWKIAGISPLSPREMGPWLRRQQAISQTAADLRQKRIDHEQIQGEIKAAREEVSRMLQSIGGPPANQDDSLRALLQRGQDFHEAAQTLGAQLAEIGGQLQDAQEDFREAENQYTQAEGELAEWRTNWAEEMRRLGLGERASSAQANSVLALTNELFQKHHDADQVRVRIEGIDGDAKQFSDDAHKLVRRLLPELAGQSVEVEAVVAELNSRLVSARSSRQQQESLEKQRKQQEQKRRQFEGAKLVAQAQLDAMCREAACDGYEKLPEMEERSRRRRELESSVRQIVTQLLTQGGGKTLDELLGEIELEDNDPEGLQQRIDRLEEESQQLSQERDDVLRKIEAEKHELARMDGNDKAVLKAEECEGLVAQLGEDLHQLAVLRLATAALRQGIERYRQKNQGPILEHASQLFTEITRGSFEGLQTDFNDRGEPVLLGIRPGARETVGVDGMSDGTCDQLYLALRIASLQVWLNHHEPMPFIVDDILLNFDDDRAAATLKVLARLAQRTQVIFFTHHRRLVDLTAEHLQQGTVTVHQLPGPIALPA